MRYAVGQIICSRMEELKIHYPVLTSQAKKDLEAAKAILLKEGVKLKDETGLLKEETTKDTTTQPATRKRKTKEQ